MITIELHRPIFTWKNDVYVISDEIWSDLYRRDLIGSYHIVYSRWRRDRPRKESSLNHCNNMNVLSIHALIGAYESEGQAGRIKRSPYEKYHLRL